MVEIYMEINYNTIKLKSSLIAGQAEKGETHGRYDKVRIDDIAFIARSALGRG